MMINMQAMPALPFTLAIVAGMVASYFLPVIPQWLSLILIAGCVGAEVYVLNRPVWRPYPVIIAFFFLGAFAMTGAKNKIAVKLPWERTTIEGTVIDAPRKTARRTLFALYVQEGSLKGKKLRCYVGKKEFDRIHLGQAYSLTGKVHRFWNFRNNTNFNYPRWAESHSLVGETYIGKNNFYETGNKMESLPFFERIALKSKLLRAKILALFAEEDIAPDHYALVSAMAFGDKSTLTQETRDMFARTGVAHLLALSGMHLGILFFLLSMIFIRFRWRIAGSVIVAATIWMYVLLVGMPASVVRAAVMLTIYMVATIDGRDRMSANALFVTVALMLLCSPLMIWDVGFQLSVVSLLSIFSFCPSFYRIVGTKTLFRHPVLRKVWAMISMSLAAQIGTAPLSIYYFGRISIYFLLTNIIAIPLVTLLLYCVFMSLVFWWLPLLRVIFLYAMRVISTVLEKVLEVIDSWKGASIENISINFLQLVLMYVAVIVLAAALKKISSRLEERRSRTIRI